ncbi:MULTISPECIES: sulfite exporter TauE/SafE family protein [unclassified Rhodanobacter]|uniref:sulfite exporter TauE/SafE family protein n=1 Tax=unclassified Rhodanobacter TaxID=2621553 RepID=UPI001BDDF5C9|nr:MULTISPECIES: sulfite exporter TauE/SafE family protein [unclassified Rhodanobacter]MBT2143603.1 sulfite exporter TauE/SafE family protein [Rhodanobacter sp. LX-99]MBT2147323.1 sulfite exporter TauE/SafE family protein [Rhodanobacter sp. LX-100]
MDYGQFFIFVGVGLLAQLVDGALGMAYGLVSNSILLALGLPPAVASATVHTAEVLTTGVSGASHAWFGNVRWKLFWQLAIPGAIGGILGATFLASVPGEAIRPWVNAYLLILGTMVLLRAFGRRLTRHQVQHSGVLGFFAGLLDAIGGGGWGPLATSTLIARGGGVRSTIGSVNAAEFVVTVCVSATLVWHVGAGHWPIVLGLLTGGVIAAPFAAWLVRHLPEHVVMAAVGGLIVLISLGQLVQTLL